jgi:hypothetical protein
MVYVRDVGFLFHVLKCTVECFDLIIFNLIFRNRINGFTEKLDYVGVDF